MIYIITVYDSTNYGSFFQAYSMMNELLKYDDVRFVDVHHQNTWKSALVSAGKCFIHGRLGSGGSEIKNCHVFAREKRVFNTVDLAQINSSKDDFFIFGSDEIWNITREKIRRTKEFFGFNFPENNRIAAAVSINQTSLEQLKANAYVTDELSKFKAISCRDYHSVDTIGRLLSRKIEFVGDPTLMAGRKLFDALVLTPELAINSNYLIIYTYGKMLSKENIASIVSFAEIHSLKIVSVGKWNDFSDFCLNPTPKEFLGLFKNARYIFTDTFHGLMFSLIFERQFVVFPCNNTKVEDSLKYFQLENRLFQSKEELNAICLQEIQYGKVTALVNEAGESLHRFLKSNLTGEG